MNEIQSQSSQTIVVSNFSDLMTTSFSGIRNTICWQRNLAGDFEEIVNKIKFDENMSEVSAEDLISLQLSKEGDIARSIILEDLRLLNDAGASPSLNLIKKYDRDEDFNFISTDVYSFHVDRSPFATSTFLCTYFGPSSDILPNDQALQKVLIPEIREKLKELHNGSNTEFDSFLEEFYFDLHYEPLANAQPISLEKGNLWRLSVDHPGQDVPPCIHRAPTETDGEYRLLLIC